MKRLISAILFFLCLLLSSSYVWARISVSPMKFELTIPQGGTRIFFVQVTNVGDKPSRVRIYQGDWDEDLYNRDRYFSPGALERSGANWIRFSPESFSLRAQETKEVRVEVTVPEDNKLSGSYWSLLFVEEELMPTKAENRQTGINTIVRYGVKVFVALENTQIMDGAITNMSISTAENNELLLEITFENKGNVLLHPTGYLEVRDEEGDTIRELNIDRFTILPEHSKTSKVLTQKPEQIGQYTALAVLQFGADYLVAGELVFKVVAK